MPQQSFMCVYANLSHEENVFNATDIMFQEKVIEGLAMPRWVYQISDEERNKWYNLIAQDFKNGAKIFGSKFIKTITLSEIKDSLKESEKVASQGKYLIKFE